jgi:hypothetical protein
LLPLEGTGRADVRWSGRRYRAFIGIAVREETNELIAYVCDGLPEGPPEAATIDAWFQGPIEGDEVSLTADSGRSVSKHS